MKVYISADIEGITGVTHWDEAMGRSSRDFTQQMTKEVSAACYGAIEAGASEILVKDAHGSGRNIDIGSLPMNTRVHKGWSQGPLRMMEGLDESFDAVMFVGYHSGASMGGNPLAHTFASSRFQYVKLNGHLVSEFDLNTLIAHYFGVPVIFLSGDHALCEHTKELVPTIQTVTTMTAIGASMINEHPEHAIELIRTGAEEAVKHFDKYPMVLPDYFEFEIMFKEAKDAYKAQFYPGANLMNPRTVTFETDDYMAFLKMFMFI